MTGPSNVSAGQSANDRRFLYRGASAFAVVFMAAIALVQLRVNGTHGLRDGTFIGVDIAVGLIAFRSGMVIGGGYLRLMRERRRQGL
ncbi:MAG: hypothetical protein H0U66_18075 [Gemmatimonadaceae bacterium]|nr:hypothetical protein [Gemmatimonadaceae bacterium]